MSKRLHSCLEVRELICSVHLGWTESERATAQDVEVDFSIRFDEPPPATATDQLQDTLCYGALCERIRQTISPKEFRLIEHMTEALYAELQKGLPARAHLSVSVRKPKPPVEGLRGGARFTLSNASLP